MNMYTYIYMYIVSWWFDLFLSALSWSLAPSCVRACSCAMKLTKNTYQIHIPVCFCGKAFFLALWRRSRFFSSYAGVQQCACVTYINISSSYKTSTLSFCFLVVVEVAAAAAAAAIIFLFYFILLFCFIFCNLW